MPKHYQKQKSLKELLQKYLKDKGYEYVKWNILYANQMATKNWKSFLKSALAENWGEELEAEEKRKKEARELTELTGKYKQPGGKVVEVALVSGKLYVLSKKGLIPVRPEIIKQWEKVS